VDRNVWDGGLIHRRADGQSVMAANHARDRTPL
jgi:hypothetical protein